MISLKTIPFLHRAFIALTSLGFGNQPANQQKPIPTENEVKKTPEKKVHIMKTATPKDVVKKQAASSFGHSDRTINYYTKDETAAFKKLLEQQRDNLYSYICLMELNGLFLQAKKPVSSEIMHTKHMEHVKISHALDRCNAMEFGVDSQTKKRIPKPLLMQMPEATTVEEIKQSLAARKNKPVKNSEFAQLTKKDQDAVRNLVILSMGSRKIAA